MNARALTIVAGVAVLALGLFVWRKGGVSNAAQAIGAGAVDAVQGAASGVVYGIGDAVGVPRTSESACAAALREGRTWDASFACPAGDFVGSLLGWQTAPLISTAQAQQTATSGAIVRPPPAARDSITDLFLDPHGYSPPI